MISSWWIEIDLMVNENILWKFLCRKYSKNLKNVGTKMCELQMHEHIYYILYCYYLFKYMGKLYGKHSEIYGKIYPKICIQRALYEAHKLWAPLPKFLEVMLIRGGAYKPLYLKKRH